MYAARMEVPGNCGVLAMPLGAVCRRVWRQLAGNGRRQGIAFVAAASRRRWAAPAGTSEDLLDIPTYVRMGRRLSCR